MWPVDRSERLTGPACDALVMLADLLDQAFVGFLQPMLDELQRALSG